MAMVDEFCEKNMKKDEQVIFWFYHIFWKTYIYIHGSYFFYIMYWPKAKFYSIFYYPLPHYDIQKSGNTGDHFFWSSLYIPLCTHPGKVWMWPGGRWYQYRLLITEWETALSLTYSCIYKYTLKTSTWHRWELTYLTSSTLSALAGHQGEESTETFY